MGMGMGGGAPNPFGAMGGASGGMGGMMGGGGGGMPGMGDMAGMMQLMQSNPVRVDGFVATLDRRRAVYI